MTQSEEKFELFLLLALQRLRKAKYGTLSTLKHALS